MEYKRMLKRAQEEVGSLQWLALKTRPYIAAITAICASTQARNPCKAVGWSQEIWKYLKHTSQLVMEMRPGKERPYFDVKIAADASFAPGGDRSRSGVVIIVEGVVVHWTSNKQSGSVMGAHEAELNAAVTGTKNGISLRNIVAEMKMHGTLTCARSWIRTIREPLHLFYMK